MASLQLACLPSLALQVLPDELAAVAEDHEEKEALAGAVLAAGAAPATETAAAAEAGQRGQPKKKAKKPCEGQGRGGKKRVHWARQPCH